MRNKTIETMNRTKEKKHKGLESRLVREGSDYRAKDIKVVGYREPMKDSFDDVYKACSKCLRDRGIFDAPFTFGKRTEEMP